MAVFAPIAALFLVLFGIMASGLSKAAVDIHFYDQTCPQVEEIIRQTVQNATKHDPKVPARLLRMFFHDCFIRV